MKRYLLDTSALLTLRDDEDGADVVADLMYQAQKGKVICFGCFMTLMEIFYRVWKDESELAGRIAYEKCQSLPIQWIHESKSLLEVSAEIKAQNNLSLVDAWIAASAIQENAMLVHKDPEFTSLKCPQIKLPYK
ncbi:MAG TPA: PIN domain-containing protein [Gammaproteobacteria bacterium]|nr:PIN domain-containing protein [Gammaproteobacteria bacterium]